MRVGIISDTHDQVQELKTLVQKLNEHEIEYLIHAGDWVSAFTLEYYKPIKCPIRGVWGNNVGDHRFPALAMKHGIDLQISREEVLILELDGKKISVSHEVCTHPLDTDVVIYGHDHKAKIEKKDETLYINPGTLLRETFPWLRSNPSYAIYETTNELATLFYLEKCKTP